MGTARAMARNAAAMMVSQAATWTATIVLTIYLARGLGAADYGKLQFAMALVTIYTIFVDFGTSTLITREVSRDRSRAAAYLTNALALKSGTAFAAAAIYIGSVWLMRRPPDVVHLMIIFGIQMVLSALTLFLNSFLQAFEQTHHQAWGTVADKVLKAAAVLGLLAGGYRLIPVAWALTLTSAVPLLWSLHFVLRVTRPSRALLSRKVLRELVVGSLPFFLFAVFAKVYDKIGITMLAMMTNDRVVGWYGAAYRLFESAFFVPYILYTVAFPVLSRLSASDPGTYRDAVRRVFGALSVAAVGVCVALAALAEPLVDALYSRAEFPGTTPVLQVLAIALGLMYLNTALVMILQTTDRQAQWTKAGAVAALINPAVNYLLIPRLGHVGVAVTTVLTEAVLMAMALRACPRGILCWQDAWVLARSLAAGTLLWAAIRLGLHGGLVTAGLLGAVVYAGAIVLLRVFSWEDVSLAVAAVRSGPPRPKRWP